MADRRMLSEGVIGSDDFMDMSLSAQALYMHLTMAADDDGFVNGPKRVARMLGVGNGELQELADAGLIFQFSTGNIVIRHWHLQNKITKDRYKASVLPEKNLVECDENGIYELIHGSPNLDTRSTKPCNKVTETPIQGSPNLDTSSTKPCAIGKVSIGKVSIGKDSIGKVSIAAAATRAREAVDNSQPVDNSQDEVMTSFSNNIHPITGQIEMEKLADLENHYGKDWMLAAIQEAVENNGRSVRYIESILSRWERDGFKSKKKGRASEGSSIPQFEMAARVIAMMDKQERLENEQAAGSS